MLSVGVCGLGCPAFGGDAVLVLMAVAPGVRGGLHRRDSHVKVRDGQVGNQPFYIVGRSNARQHATADERPAARRWSSCSSLLSLCSNTSMVEVLRRPVESALVAGVGMADQTGQVGDALVGASEDRVLECVQASVVVIEDAARQPITRRENASITNTT